MFKFVFVTCYVVLFSNGLMLILFYFKGFMFTYCLFYMFYYLLCLLFCFMLCLFNKSVVFIVLCLCLCSCVICVRLCLCVWFCFVMFHCFVVVWPGPARPCPTAPVTQGHRFLQRLHRHRHRLDSRSIGFQEKHNSWRRLERLH